MKHDRIKEWLRSHHIGFNLVYQYPNGYWQYTDLKGKYHFFNPKDIELTKDKVAVYTHSYANGSWEYEDIKGNYHLFNKSNTELTKGITAKEIYYHSDRSWGYKDVNGKRHEIERKKNV